MKYFTFITALVLIVVPMVSFADFIPCDGSSANGGIACTECHFVQMGNTILKWLIGVLFAVFAVVAAMGGFGLVTSGGNQQALEDAKEKLKNALIGLIIVLAAWLLVDTVMRGLLSSGTDDIKGYGPWSEVKCGTVAVSTAPSIDSTFAVTGTYGFQAFTYDDAKSCKVGHSGSYLNQAACEAAVAAVEAANSKFYLTKKCDDSTVNVNVPSWGGAASCAAASDPTADNAFTYQPGIAAQAGHASPKINAMLTCMAKIVPGNVGEISSFSDSVIANGTKTWAQCRIDPKPKLSPCAHAPTSYHYGHSGLCGDKSYAVDFGDEGNATVLCKAANSCGTVKNCSVHNGNHVHLEIPCP
ncbi:MAG: hypothetical protein KBC35_00845 [Candidatus Pacebacteria bacterium]|nr:hypothetical protein [Candidatus Paceibacterota bacterium]